MMVASVLAGGHHHHHQRVYVSKWVTFAASALLQACAGLAYSVSVYLPTVKDALGLSQTQVATVGSSVNLGGYFAVVSGYLYDSLKEHHRLGPRLVVWLGALCCFGGYLGMYLMVAGHTDKDFLHLLLFAAAAGNAGTWFDTSALVTSVRNFPNDRGMVVGVLKSFLGLSSSIFTSIYACAFESDARRFLLLLALAPSALTVALSCGLNYVPYVEASEASHAACQRRFMASFVGVGALAVYQMATAVVQGTHPFSQAGRTAAVVVMGGLLALAALLPVPCGSWRASYAHHYIHTRESALDDEDDCSSGDEGDARSWPAAQQPPEFEQAGGRLAAGRAGLPGFASVPHQRVTVGQLRTVGAVSGPAVPRSRSASTGAALAGSSAGPPAVQAAAAAPAAGGCGGRDSRPGSRGGQQRLHLAEDGGHERAPLLAGALGPGGQAAGGAGPDPLGPAAAEPQPPALQLGSLTTQQMLCTLTFWLLFFQFTVASGVCLAYLNNLGQLVASLDGAHDGQLVFVSLFSVANAAGRLLAGYVPEQCLHSRGVPRTVFLTATAALTAASALAVAYASLGAQYVISLLLGLAFGAHWSLLPAIISDLFGLKHFAANYTTFQFAPAAGSYLLATCLTGWLYDRAAEAHGDRHQCVGQDCFGQAFTVMAGLAALSTVACGVATARSRRAYAAVSQHLKTVDTIEGHATPDGDL